MYLLAVRLVLLPHPEEEVTGFTVLSQREVDDCPEELDDLRGDARALQLANQQQEGCFTFFQTKRADVMQSPPSFRVKAIRAKVSG